MIVASPLDAEYARLAGWCSPEKRAYLQAIIHATRPALAAEIGVFGGSSAVPMAVAMKQNGHGTLYAIDPWLPAPCLEGVHNDVTREWWAKLDHEQVRRGFLEALSAFGVREHVQVIRATSDEAVGHFRDHSLGLLHIDGCHSREPAMRDGMNYLPKVKVGGWICCDDESWSEGGVLTVKPMIDYLCDHGCEYVTSVTGAAMLRKVR